MRFRALSMAILIWASAVPMTVQAQSQSLPFIDQLTSPFTDSELGGVGCLTASAVTGGMLVYLMGGFGRIAASMQGPIPPIRVMEGAAAASFIFSSVCYIGAALAPLAMLVYTSITDNMPEDFDFPNFINPEAPPKAENSIPAETPPEITPPPSVPDQASP